MIRLSERISTTICKAILDGAYTPGERLPSEIDLAAEYQVSRSVIRESLRNLEGLGMVAVKKGPKGGIFVVNHFHRPVCNSLKSLVNAGRISPENIFEVMHVLMRHAAARAAVFGEPGEPVESALFLDGSQAGTGDIGGILSGQKNFFLELAAASKNPVVEVLVNAMIELLGNYFTDIYDPAFEKISLNFRNKMSTCISDKDSEAAARLMNDFILDMRRRVYQAD